MRGLKLYYIGDHPDYAYLYRWDASCMKFNLAKKANIAAVTRYEYGVF